MKLVYDKSWLRASSTSKFTRRKLPSPQLEEHTDLGNDVTGRCTDSEYSYPVVASLCNIKLLNAILTPLKSRGTLLLTLMGTRFHLLVPGVAFEGGQYG